jgi:acyl-CoA thioester hydrolase
MPAVHHQTFQANFYECDAYGFLHNITYFRWMQEAAFGASAAVGYDFARYNAMHHLWLVRETELDVFVPIEYGEAIELETYVEGFRRFRSRRAYKFTNLSTHQVVAQASTDWVYVDAENLRPAKIPAEMQSAFFPEGPPAEDGSRKRFLALSLPDGKIFSMNRTVRWHEIDQMWHVNNAMYLLYLEESGNRANANFGWPLDCMQSSEFRIVPGRQHVEYRLPAILGDKLTIITWLSNVQPSSVLRHYQIKRASDDSLLVQAVVKLNWIDLETGNPVPIPTEYLRDIEPNLVMG